MLDFRMDTFIAVCECMNFTRAAESLSITQPAVSQHIRALEEYYGTKLFASEGRKMRLTKAGELLLQSARTMRHDERYLRETLGEKEEGKRTLHFGVTLTIGDFVIGKRLARFVKKHPEVTVCMQVANTKKLLQRLEGGEIDFAIVEGYFAKKEYDYLRFSRENYIAVCGKDYETGPAKTLEELCGHTLLVRETGSGSREILERELESRNLVPADFHRVIEVSSISTIKTLIKENCGITFLYEAAAREELKAGSLREIKLEDVGVQHDFTFIWNKGSLFSSYYHEIFNNFLEE